jgi:hypothetical protein
MKRNLFYGLAISFGNLFLYALVLDLLFDSHIYQQLFRLDVTELFGSSSSVVGIIVSICAIFIEVLSYKVIRKEAPK